MAQTCPCWGHKVSEQKKMNSFWRKGGRNKLTWSYGFAPLVFFVCFVFKLLLNVQLQPALPLPTFHHDLSVPKVGRKKQREERWEQEMCNVTVQICCPVRTQQQWCQEVIVSWKMLHLTWYWVRLFKSALPLGCYWELLPMWQKKKKNSPMQYILQAQS